MIIKKLLIYFSLAAFLLLSLTACGGDTAPVAEPPVEKQSSTPEDMPDEEDEAPMEESTPEPEPTDEPQPEQPVDTAQVSYSADVQPILESRCFNCHGGDRVEGDFVVGTYADMLVGGESGPVVVPGDADASYLVELLLDQKMPKRGPKLTPVQTETIITWINQGAKDN